MWAPFENLLVPKEPSLVWVTIVSPLSGRTHKLFSHSHVAKGAFEMWYVSGSYEQLGLPAQSSGHPSLQGTGTLSLVDEAGMEAWKIKLLINMRSAGLRFRCIATRPRGLLEWGDRQPRQRCFEGSDHVTKGEPITGIMWNTPVEEETFPIRQHFHFQWYIETSGEPYNNVPSLVPIVWGEGFTDSFVNLINGSSFTLEQKYDLCWLSNGSFPTFDWAAEVLNPTLKCKDLIAAMASYLAVHKGTGLGQNWRFDTGNTDLRADGASRAHWAVAGVALLAAVSVAALRRSADRPLL